MITSPITIIIEYKSEEEQNVEWNALRIIVIRRKEDAMQNRRDDNIKLRSLGFEFMRFYASFRVRDGEMVGFTRE